MEKITRKRERSTTKANTANLKQESNIPEYEDSKNKRIIKEKKQRKSLPRNKIKANKKASSGTALIHAGGERRFPGRRSRRDDERGRNSSVKSSCCERRAASGADQAG